MTSRERMLAALACEPVDYVPCSFMIFRNMHERSSGQRDFVERQLALGLDAYVHVGHLSHALHPEARCTQWTEKRDGELLFHRRIDTPQGPLTACYEQSEGWPRDGEFPLFDDWLIGRAKESLVDPERDLEKLPYIFAPFRDDDIQCLRESAREARQVAEEHKLLQVGGWASYGQRSWDTDAGVMGADAMAWLSGYEPIMVLSLTAPGIIKEYVRIIHEWNMRQIAIYLDVTEADVIWRRAWYETVESWTPDAYREIIAPALKREVELVHQAGRKYGYIITSAFMPILDTILDTGIDVLVGLDPEEGKGTELGAVKARFRAERRAIWGGVSGAISVEQGTAKDTAQAVRTALGVRSDDSGFILSPVDNVRENTDNAWRNTEVFIDTWRRHRNLPT